MVVATDCGVGRLQAGQSAPGFDLPDADMQAVSLAGFRNRSNVVLYFYPKDDTPGCTMQAIEFSDRLEEFHDLLLGLQERRYKQVETQYSFDS